MSSRRLVRRVSVLTLLVGISGWGEARCPRGAETPALSGDFALHGIDVGTMSGSVEAGDDFFTYVNEGWIASTPIPDGHWDYGQTTVLAMAVDRQISDLLDETLTSRSPRSDEARQVGDAYASFLDTASIERGGLAKLRSELARLTQGSTPESIARWMAHPASSSIIAINVYPAEGRWRIHLDQLNLVQPMLGLPNADDYARDDPASASMRESYRAYVAETFEIAGIKDASTRAERLLLLETQIAANLWPLEKLRDRRANYHPMSVEELLAYAPGFPWRTFLAARGAADESEVVLGTDSAVQIQARLFASTPIEDWKSYLAFHWIRNQIDILPEDFRRAHWEFYGRTLSRATSPPGREDVAARLVRNALGQQLGKLYSQRFVTRQTIASAKEMIGYLQRAFAERLTRATWMDDATRSQAQAKLARFQFKVGYPDRWRDFSGIRIVRDDAAGNLQRLWAWDWEHQLRRLDSKSDVELWYQTPQTVDASYSVLTNAIELPAAFLQPPYFDAAADPAVNFGAIGAIVGHEMGHAFDDQGIIYDHAGRMRNWWSEHALAQFRDRSRALIDQYNAFSPFPGVHVNGERTLGENIADLSGVMLAFRAYHLYLDDHPCARGAAMDGLTSDQRFFMAWAQAWRYKAPESAIRHVIRYGYHSPTPYRVNGVMQNMDEWYVAFGVRPGHKLYVPPEQRVRIW